MATRESMLANYQASQSYAGANYDAAKGRMPARFSEGVQRAFGVTPGPNTMRKYQEKVQRAQYRPGDANYWMQRTIEGISR